MSHSGGGGGGGGVKKGPKMHASSHGQLLLQWQKNVFNF